MGELAIETAVKRGQANDREVRDVAREHAMLGALLIIAGELRRANDAHDQEIPNVRSGA
jgi:hypothetical protein